MLANSHLLREIAGALGRRVGTAFSALLIGQGLPPGQIEQLVVGLAVVGGIVFDMVVAMIHERAKT